MSICPSDDWEAVCDAGREAAARLDAGRWEIGDLAAAVGKRYGADALGAFAIEIGVEKKRCQEYRQVAGFFPEGTRHIAPLLSYSHYRAAMRMGTLPAALAFLEECADGAWTVEQTRLEAARRRGNAAPAGRRLRCEGIILSAGPDRVLFEVPADVGREMVKAQAVGRRHVGLVITLEGDGHA